MVRKQAGKLKKIMEKRKKMGSHTADGIPATDKYKPESSHRPHAHDRR